MNNENYRTIRKFSTDASREYKIRGTGAYHPDFRKFVVYYGSSDFTDEIILGALHSKAVRFRRHTLDLQEWGFLGRSIAVKSSIFLIMTFQVISELENALEECDSCYSPRETCSAVHSIDQAVAFYVGSLSVDGSGLGNLMYTLADITCREFKTCGYAGDSIIGRSYVNLQMFPLFWLMKDSIINADLANGKLYKEAIAVKLFIPLIQSTLRFAYERGKNPNPTEAEEALSFMYATSILPLLHHCSPTDASTVLANVRIGQSGTANFDIIKATLENNYACLKVTCEDIGGYYDYANYRYYPGAEPCVSKNPSRGGSFDIDFRNKLMNIFSARKITSLGW